MKKRYFALVISLILLGLGVFSTRPISFAQNTADPDARVVTVYADGIEKTIATNAETVGSVLEKIDVDLTEHDKTEPSSDTELKGNEFIINVYRARPIVVVDGANSYTVMTAERSPKQIATDAGFTTNPEDKFGYVRSDDPFEGAPGTQMIIKRAKTIIFDFYGKASKIRTHAHTIQEFLDEKEITLEEGDELSAPLETRLKNGMKFSLAKVDKNRKTEEVEVPFEEEQISDASQPVSYRQIKTPGKNGKKLVTYDQITKNGKPAGRKVIKEVITEQPVKQVVIVGGQSVGGSNAQLLLKLRTCETGGNYRANTGNGYYGAYQFSLPTWQAMGTGYARPDIAPPAVQDDATLRLARRSGFHSQFPGCSAKLGLPAYPN